MGRDNLRNQFLVIATSVFTGIIASVIASSYTNLTIVSSSVIKRSNNESALDDLAISFLILAVLALGVSIIILFVTELFKKYFNPSFERRITGIWIEEFMGSGIKNELGIGEIIYNPDYDSLHFYGAEFRLEKDTVKHIASWNTTAVFVNYHMNKVFYSFDGNNIVETETSWGPPGNGHITFRKTDNKDKYYSTGIARFSSSRIIVKHAGMRKLDERLMDELHIHKNDLYDFKKLQKFCFARDMKLG